MEPEIIKNRVNELSPTYRSFLEGDQTLIIVKTFAEAHSLSVEDTQILANGFSLYLLLLINENQFSKFISGELGLDNQQAELLAHTMKMALPKEIQKGLSEADQYMQPTINTENETTVKELIKNPETITVPINNPGWRQIATEPTPAALEPAPAIPPLRTMAGDSNRQIGYQSLDEETHSSTQDSLLENRH